MPVWGERRFSGGGCRIHHFRAVKGDATVAPPAVLETSALMAPALVAAIVSGTVALVSLIANVLVSVGTSQKRLEADRFALERRAELEAALAERKMILDRQLRREARKAEVAELLLAEFYEAQRIFEIVRSPMIWAEEMVLEEGVSEEVIKNSGYAILRRMRRHGEFFARIEARRHLAAALLGPAILHRFKEITLIHNQIIGSARAILENREFESQEFRSSSAADTFMMSQQKIAFATGRPDELAEQMQLIINKLEAVCRPIIEAETYPETHEISGSKS